MSGLEAGLEPAPSRSKPGALPLSYSNTLGSYIRRG